VPGLLGSFADIAAATLRAAGLEATIVVAPEPPPGSPTRAGRVWKQSPISFATEDEGTAVTIYVNPSAPAAPPPPPATP
jgi:PASTA domain